MVQITVIGSDTATGKVLEMAEEVGKEIALAGSIVICGGMEGVMKAVCKGAHENGGLTVGILPHNKEEGNEFLDIRIPTNIGYSRNAIVACSGDAIISIAGSVGTLTEIIYGALEGIPIILLEGLGGITDSFSILEDIPEISDKLDRKETTIYRATTPKEAVELALKYSKI